MNKELKYLSAISTLPEYRLDRPIVFLTDSVVTEEFKVQPKDFSFEILPNIWQNQNFLNEKRLYLDKVYESLSAKIALILNQIHGVVYPQILWELPMSKWLLHYIHILFDRYYRLKIASEKYGMKNLTMLVCKGDFDLSTNSYGDFAAKFALSELTVSSLYGQVAKKMGIDNEEFVFTEKAARLEPPSEKGSVFSSFFSRGSVSNFINKSSRKIIERGMKGNDCLINNYNIFCGYEQFYFAKEIKASFFPRNREFKKILEEVDRDKLSEMTADDDFERIAISLLPKFIPKYLLEEFESYKYHSEKWSNYRIYLSDVGFGDDILFCYSAAFGKLKGGKIVGVQHGGGYGNHDIEHNEYIERRVCDVFITWGWDDTVYSGAKLLPLSVPRFSKILNKHKEKTQVALYVGNEIPKHLCRFQPFTYMPQYIFKYLKDSRDFVAGIDPEIRRCLIYRLYPHDMGWLKERKNLFKDFPEVRVEYRGRLVDLLQKVRLYVSDHPSTTFLEALIINTPTVLFWEFNSAYERDTAVPYFDLLRKAGILFHSPNEAAMHINNIWHDVYGWWKKPEIQKAKDEFCYYFARTNKEWRKEWADTLKRVIDK